jgi:NTE family protein
MVDAETVGLVLAGGGARGAYEAGVLSVLLPLLQARGQRPTVLVGSSVGAINAAYLGGSAHLDAGQAAAGLVDRCRETTLAQVLRPILREQLPLLGARLAGSLFSVPGVHVASLLDPSPVERNLREGNDWAALRRNIDDGVLDAVAVVATAVRSERTVVFCDAAAGAPRHRSHVLDYVRTRLGVEHAQAAAAIPLLFPPARVQRPPAAAGWYVDGGIRLNTPIKPALDLGVDRLVVIATSSVGEYPGLGAADHDSDPPDLGDVALNVFHGKLIDPLVEDLRTLGNINTFFADGSWDTQRYRRARGKRPCRQIPYLFIGPRRAGVIGQLATEVFEAHYGGVRQLRSPDLAVLAELLGAQSHTHNELFSYLFFAREFIEALIEMGVADAHAWLHAPPGPDQPWQVDPLDAFLT